MKASSDVQTFQRPMELIFYYSSPVLNCIFLERETSRENGPTKTEKTQQFLWAGGPSGVAVVAMSRHLKKKSSVSKSNLLETMKLHFSLWFQRPHSPRSLLGMLIKSKTEPFLATYGISFFLSPQKCPGVVVQSGTNTSQMQAVGEDGREAECPAPSPAG